MRHVVLTCVHHRQLRWSCKDIAFSGDGHGYNGQRNIFFLGTVEGSEMHKDMSGLSCPMVDKQGKLVEECECSASDLVRAPEDKLVKKD